MTRKKKRRSNNILNIIFLLLLLCSKLTFVSCLGGGEKATLTTTITTPSSGNSSNSNSDINNSTTTTTTTLLSTTIYRQNICNRVEEFDNGDIELRYALRGLQLHPLFISRNNFINYNYSTGIDRNFPGIGAILLDELANRAGFTWRNSFGIIDEPKYYNATYSDVLLWSVEHYDISVSWWDQSIERMERGVTYPVPWFDGSIMLITKPNNKENDDSKISSSSSTQGDESGESDNKQRLAIWNWTRPFEPEVWLLIGFTIVLSGLVFQIIEGLSGERDGRSWWQWTGDNQYLTWLNATQNYEYAPSCPAGRIYGVSMGIWAMVLTASYTANLASMLVETPKTTQPPPASTTTQSSYVKIGSIEDAIKAEQVICTYANSNSDLVIENRWPDAKRLRLSTELEGYEALESGKCDVLAAYKDNWLSFQQDSRYNPSCDMEWVGRFVEIFQSGWALKADSGRYCTSFIRDVFNLHLTEMIQDGILDDAWKKHRSQNIYAQDCSDYTDIDDDDDDDDNNNNNNNERRTRRSSSYEEQRQRSSSSFASHHRRKLKGGGGGNAAAATTATSSDGTPVTGHSLSLREMAGTFVLHYLACVFALVIAIIHKLYRRRQKQLHLMRLAKAGSSTKEIENEQPAIEFVRTRPHGPIIGQSPKLNTWKSTRSLENKDTRSTHPLDSSERSNNQGGDISESDFLDDFSFRSKYGGAGGSSNKFRFGGNNRSSIGRYIHNRSTRSTKFGGENGSYTTSRTTNDPRIAFRDHIGFIPEENEEQAIATTHDQHPRHNDEEFHKLQQDTQELKSQQQGLTTQMSMVLKLLQEMNQEQQQQQPDNNDDDDDNNNNNNNSSSNISINPISTSLNGLYDRLKEDESISNIQEWDGSQTAVPQWTAETSFSESCPSDLVYNA